MTALAIESISTELLDDEPPTLLLKDELDDDREISTVLVEELDEPDCSTVLVLDDTLLDELDELADDTLLDELLDELPLACPTVLLDELDALAKAVDEELEVESDDADWLDQVLLEVLLDDVLLLD